MRGQIADRSGQVSFEAPPQDSLDELVHGEHERQHGEGPVSRSPDVSNGVDADRSDQESSDQVDLRGEAHDGPPFPDSLGICDPPDRGRTS